MQHYVYLLSLLGAATGVLLLDRRFKLAWFWQPGRTAWYIAIGFVFFLAWDVTGVALDVFSTNQVWVTGLYVVTPDLPIEEIIFLLFLNYLALCSWRFACLRTR
ncbi:MAG TPA: lycopene cyclase domain-containing protein [Candidatus Saccharimonadales bacterium]|nr:lycopene cyclase domain-containing protein [Candidatus Saccharimonadales bacterium]